MLLVLVQAILSALQLVAAAARWGSPWYATPSWLYVLCGALATVALALAVAAKVSLGKAFRAHPRPRRDAHLVRTGVYTTLRHPMYLSVLLVFAALMLRRPSWPLALATAANVVFYFAKARYEEGLLRAKYPDYASYQTRSWGILPGLGRRR